MLVVGAEQQFAVHARMTHLDDRRPAGGAHGADEFDAEFIRHVNQVEQRAVALQNFGGVMDEEPGQFGVTRIGHKLFLGRKLAARGQLSSPFGMRRSTS